MVAIRYVVIAQDLKERASNGEFPDKFPTYKQIVRQYNTSLRTVIKVMDKLRAEGIVYTEGRSSYIKKGS